MNGTRELAPMPFDVTLLASTTAFVWDPRWYPVIGMANIDLNLDLRAVMVGGGTVSVQPALQFAGVRTERPDEGALISGSPRTSNGITHYLESIGAPTKTWFRRGVGYQLTTGTFGRAQGLLYTAWRVHGELMPAEEISLPMTRGAWVNLMSGWQSTTAGDSEVAPADVCLAGRSLTSHQWMELGLGVRKIVDGSANSRCIFGVIPAIQFT